MIIGADATYSNVSREWLREEAQRLNAEMLQLHAENGRLKNQVASAEVAMQEMIQVAANADAEIERLRAALKPFSDYAERIDGHHTSQGYPDTCTIGLKPEIDGTKEIVHLGDLRRARTVLQQSMTEPK